MDFSPSSAWSRTFEKYSPTRSIRHSPVISCQGKLLPFEFDNDRASTITWFVTTTEEYYYQNIIELMSIYEKGIVGIDRLLRRNRIGDYWPGVLINFELIGKGAFGEVYKANDTRTNQTYAIKQIQSEGDISKYNALNVLLERNSYIRANESSFVVKLYGAFQDIKSNWMIFEYCIGDLRTYISSVNIPAVTFMDHFLANNIITGLYSAYKIRLSLDVETMALIYSFELLAGLDYLAKRILIHRDLKPDNVLMSVTGHLKIADLGLTQRLRWIDRESILGMVEPSELKELEKKDEKVRFSGNVTYTDPEAIIYYQLLTRSCKIYANIASSEFPITNGVQDFLTDLYSVSLIIMELLFVGMNFITTDRLSADVAEEFGIRMTSKKEMAFFLIRCIYDEDVSQAYLFKILNNQTTDNNQSLIAFMKSCYRPKRQRALNYTKFITYYQFKNMVKSRCIDIKRIEEMDIYKSRNITTFNVNLLPIGDTVFGFYKKVPSEIEGLTFKDFQEHINGPNDKFGFHLPSFNYAE